MKKSYFFSVLLLSFVVLLGGCLHQSAADPDDDDADGTVRVKEEFETKIVYDPQSSSDMAAYRADCQERGGTFNECGSPCAPDAEVCILMCTYTCEFEGEDDDDEVTLETYENATIGFTIEYPQQMDVGSENAPGEAVRFTFWGPTQATGTELFDGVSMTVRRDSYGADMSFEGYVEAQVAEVANVGTVVEVMQETTVNGMEAYTYTTDTVGVTTHLYFPLENNEFVSVSYSAPDPTDQGFDEWIDAMLASLEIANTVELSGEASTQIQMENGEDAMSDDAMMENDISDQGPTVDSAPLY